MKIILNLIINKTISTSILICKRNEIIFIKLYNNIYDDIKRLVTFM